LATDTLAQEILEGLQNGDKKHKTVSFEECEVHDGLILVNGLVYVPEIPDLYLRILKNCHDHPVAGHQAGQAAMYVRKTCIFQKMHYFLTLKSDEEPGGICHVLSWETNVFS